MLGADGYAGSMSTDRASAPEPPTEAPGARHVEIERKFDVPVSAELPDATAIDGVARARRSPVAHLDAVYLDTDDLALMRERIAVRRRTGGHDAGWHVKATAAHGRVERHWPIDPDAPDTPPQGLVDAICEMTGDAALSAALHPIARIRTERTATDLFDAADRRSVEIADDVVQGTDLRDGTVRRWREWETELDERLDDAPGGEGARLLDALTALLIRSGARPSAAVAKLQHTLGLDRLARDTAAGALGPVVTTLAGELDEQLDAAIADRPDGVHQARIRVRRLRSMLDTFGALFADRPRRRARRALKRLGADLGRARDAEVRARDAARRVAGLPQDAPARRLERTLVAPARDTYTAEHRRLTRVLTERRRQEIARLLGALVTPDAATDLGRAPARRTLQRLLADAVAALRVDDDALVTLWAGLPGHGVSPAQAAALEAALHLVRKDARRIRYAADALGAVPLPGGDGPLSDVAATALSHAAKRLQDLLGDQRDDMLFAAHVLAVATTDAEARRSPDLAEPYLALALDARRRAAADLTTYGDTRDRLLAAADRALGRQDGPPHPTNAA